MSRLFQRNHLRRSNWEKTTLAIEKTVCRLTDNFDNLHFAFAVVL